MEEHEHGVPTSDEVQLHAHAMLLERMKEIAEIEDMGVQVTFVDGDTGETVREWNVVDVDDMLRYCEESVGFWLDWNAGEIDHACIDLHSREFRIVEFNLS